MKITRMRLLGGAAALATAAAVLPATAAVAFNSPPLVLEAEPRSPAHLVARGAAVDVPVEYSCTANLDGMFIRLRLTEVVGGRIASGVASRTVPCDGATRVLVMRVAPETGSAPFATGRASVTTYVDGCYVTRDRFICGSDSIERTVRIRR